MRLESDHLLTKKELKRMLKGGMAELEADEEEAKEELKEDLRFMHYSFWRWTSILLELKFEDPMDNASVFRLKAFRFYSKVAMVVAAALYLNTALLHSPAFSQTPDLKTDDMVFDGKHAHPKKYWFLEYKDT